MDTSLDRLPVLVVDDDPASAKLASVTLTCEGCDIRIARSAEEALVLLRVFKPRLILLDLILPHMSGLLLAETLKRNPETSDIPIIAVSSTNGPATERLVRAAGCVAYLRKPIDPIALPERVASCLGGAA